MHFQKHDMYLTDAFHYNDGLLLWWCVGTCEGEEEREDEKEWKREVNKKKKRERETDSSMKRKQNICGINHKCWLFLCRPMLMKFSHTLTHTHEQGTCICQHTLCACVRARECLCECVRLAPSRVRDFGRGQHHKLPRNLSKGFELMEALQDFLQVE